MPRAPRDGITPFVPSGLCLADPRPRLQLKESMDDAEEDDYADGDEYDFDDPSSEEEQ